MSEINNVVDPRSNKTDDLFPNEPAQQQQEREQEISQPQEEEHQHVESQEENIQQEFIEENEGEDKHFQFCCKKCKSNLQHNNKTCVCVVPRSQRRVKLTQQGCRVCGCQGCTKEDKDFFSGKTENKEKRFFRKKSADSDISVNSRQNQHHEELGNLNNFQYSSTIQKILQAHQVYAPQIGIGIPERTKGYLTGRNPNYNYKQ